jgi:hypothetical protein
MNGAEVIAEILKREGTEFLSCYPRNPVIEPCAALDIRPILCRQERVGVGIADGYSRIKRGKRNGVFAAQAGPGIENAFPGVAQAYSENVPLLIVAGGMPLSRQYVRPVFRAAEVFAPVTKWSALAHSAQELPALLRRAYHAMRSGKAGPVLIEVPDDVFNAEFKGDLDYRPVRGAARGAGSRRHQAGGRAACSPPSIRCYGADKACTTPKPPSSWPRSPNSFRRRWSPPIPAKALFPTIIRSRSAPRPARAQNRSPISWRAPISSWRSARASPSRISGRRCRRARPSSIPATMPATSTRTTAPTTRSSATRHS